MELGSLVQIPPTHAIATLLRLLQTQKKDDCVRWLRGASSALRPLLAALCYLPSPLSVQLPGHLISSEPHCPHISESMFLWL